MTLTDLQRDILQFRRSLYRPTPRQTVVEWAEANLMLTNPPYVDVAVKRWQAFTGKQATLESTGKTFDAIAVKRAK